MTVSGINFRGSSGFVTDPANCTYCAIDMYPTTRGGVTFGWLSVSNVAAADRSAAVDARLAGINYVSNSSASPMTCRVDLPSAGTYAINLAIGDQAAASHPQYVQLKDGATSLFTMSGVTSAGNSFRDASGAQWSAAAWPGSNVSATITMAGTNLSIIVGSATSQSDASVLAHIFWALAASGPPLFLSESLGLSSLCGLH